MNSVTISRKHSLSSPSTQSQTPLPKKTRRCPNPVNYLEEPSPKSQASSQQIDRSSQLPSPSSASFEVRAIFDERVNSTGETEFLIDWEDNSQTGQIYSPSWEPAVNVSAPLAESKFRRLQFVGQQENVPKSRDEAVESANNLNLGNSDDQQTKRQTTSSSIILDSQQNSEASPSVSLSSSGPRAFSRIPNRLATQHTPRGRQAVSRLPSTPQFSSSRPLSSPQPSTDSEFHLIQFISRSDTVDIGRSRSLNPPQRLRSSPKTTGKFRSSGTVPDSQPDHLFAPSTSLSTTKSFVSSSTSNKHNSQVSYLYF